ncbi:hypothetical protein PPUN14671_07280 [Pseudomonas putida]|uniref:Transposase n=1 Tax=Pseudomonas putida TaxID=303 RepID=A0AA37R922_PSEPU|nr:hypothetical protein PPUN14671_07280 [Pseudomonas putida]
MSQMSFSDFEYAGERKQTRGKRFLAKMEQVWPTQRLCRRDVGYSGFRETYSAFP